MASERRLLCQDCGHHIHRPQACQWDFWPNHRQCPCPTTDRDALIDELVAAVERLPSQSIPDNGNIGRDGAGWARNDSGHVRVVGRAAVLRIMEGARHE